MQIVYPYNEILPKKKAHDIFIVHECAALSQAGTDLTLLCGRGTLPDEALFPHYNVPPFPIERLPILRKNTFLNLSWNRPFFHFSHAKIAQLNPDWAFLSVLKQAAYHLKRKIPGVRYLYEVHQLSYYPNMSTTPPSFHVEKEMLSQVDLITVTTQALKEILRAPPYVLTVPIEVIPLAVQTTPLPPPPQGPSFTLMYIGQFYEGQGVEKLISAIAPLEGVKLKIVGGRPEEIERLKQEAPAHVEFLGFISPAHLSEVAAQAHAFVAPFENRGRMPYVAHTKLYEYAHWGRPILAPDLPIVHEHFEKGVIFYKEASLQEGITKLRAKCVELQEEMKGYAGCFSWKKRAETLINLLSQAPHGEDQPLQSIPHRSSQCPENHL